jgi:MFS family permease
MVARLSISPIVPQVTDAFNVSNTLIGFALTGMWLAYALAQFPSGVISDTYGERSVILLSIGGTAVSSLLLALSPKFSLFLFATVLIGVTTGLYYTPSTTILSRLYEETGSALGIHQVGSPLAGLLTPIAVTWIATHIGWRPALAVASLVAMPILLLLYFHTEPVGARDSKTNGGENPQFETILELLIRPSVFYTILIAILYLFVWQGLSSFLPTFFVESRGYSTTIAGVLFSAFFVIQGFMGVGLGLLSDRFSRDLAIFVSISTSLLGISLIVAGPGFTAVLGGILFLGIGMGGYTPILARFVDLFTESEQSVGIGLVRTVSGVFGASGSIVVGFFADYLSWTASFALLGGVLLLVLLMLGFNHHLRLGY